LAPGRRRIQTHLRLIRRRRRFRFEGGGTRKNLGHRRPELAPDFGQESGDAAATAVSIDRGEADSVGQVPIRSNLIFLSR